MSFSIKVDISHLASVPSDLRSLSDALGQISAPAINKVATSTEKRSRREIVSRVNLTETYVRDRMSLQPATEEAPVAIISARVRQTRLATYVAKQLTVAAKGAKGDPMRGISAGRKQGGVSVAVKPGGRKSMPGAFMVPLRNSNGMGVFVRTGPGKKDIAHKYGPSVDQVFRKVIEDIRPEIQRDLETAISQEADKAIARTIKK